jgi:ABC-2 type transport system ATP-binding protein
MVVTINALSRTFKTNKALNNVNLAFKEGYIHGIVGENGAGKSTLIKHILGLYKPQEGCVSVFGLDPVKGPEAVLSRIGYVSEEPELPGWMSISQYLSYMSSFYKNWDSQYAHELVKVYELDTSKINGELSKGQRARVALCVAQAHRPPLLLLDEPSSGLDPIVRRDILNAAMHTAKEDGRTVIFSSHLLDEVESISDRLVIIKKVNILLSGSLTNIVRGHFKIVLKEFENNCTTDLPGLLHLAKGSKGIEVSCFSSKKDIETWLSHQGQNVLSYKQMSLDEVFFTRSQSKVRTEPVRS